MGYREERVAKNEATSRVINEGIEAAFESDPEDTFTIIICECGLEQCDRTVRITKAEYERVRGDPSQFVIYREHLIPDMEEVLIEGDRFLLVAKREGTPAGGGNSGGPQDLGISDRRFGAWSANPRLLL